MPITRSQVPSTRVISPSPAPAEPRTPSRSRATSADYDPPVTRSAARRGQTPISSITEDLDGVDEDEQESGSSGSDPEKRARPRSRSPIVEIDNSPKRANGKPTGAKRRNSKNLHLPNGSAASHGNGHLHPDSATSAKEYWRSLSRSPSPLGLIPIHSTWRSFIHRHEIPRKLLHTSIGFITLHLYTHHVSPSTIHPILLTALLPIATTDLLRHRYPPLNRLYIRLLGALMRESEVDGYTGVLGYLAGSWAVLRFLPLDLAVLSILLLSWCDTAASTVGRACGRYTPQLRRGKSLAGSLAACVVGVATAAFFWGYLAPRQGRPDEPFAFEGVLCVPAPLRGLLGWEPSRPACVGGPWALGVMSVWAGVVASASEAVDLWGLDDNLTIPVLCGVGLGVFCWVFGP